MASSLSIVANINVEGLHRCRCENFKSGLEYAAVKVNKPTFKWVDWHKLNEKEFDKCVTKRFQNTYSGVYPCKYMDSWKRFNETSLLEKKELYSNLIENIIDATRNIQKEVGKILEDKK